MTLKAKWIDGHREPQSPPDPAFPLGKDVCALVDPEARACGMNLPYPARRCGYYLIECEVCGLSAVVTTAGRSDDPRSFTASCKPRVH